MGTDQQTRGSEAAEQTIRYLHETAFDAEPEFTSLVVDEHGAAAEAFFVGTHIGDFSGVSASGNPVRVPYSVFYDVDGDKDRSRCVSTCRWTSSSLRSAARPNRKWPVPRANRPVLP